MVVEVLCQVCKEDKEARRGRLIVDSIGYQIFNYEIGSIAVCACTGQSSLLCT